MSHTLPTVTAILLTCNRREFVAAALQSVLEQDCAPMQVIVSDDASTDGTDERVRTLLEAYRGPHRTEFHRQPDNSGSKSAHLNRVLPLARGDIIVSFDDDDLSVPRRVRRIVETFGANPLAQAAYSSFALLDAAGRPGTPGNVPHPPAGTSACAWFARIDAYAAGTTLAIRRSVHECFGAIDPRINEDVVLPFRASLLGDVVFIDEALVHVRRHDSSLTAAPERFRSLAGYRQWFLDGIDRALAQSTSRFTDIDTALALQPGRRRELEGLRDAVRASMNDASLSAGLVSSSWMTRIRTLLALWSGGAYPDDRARQVCLALAPSLYLACKHRCSR